MSTAQDSATKFQGPAWDNSSEYAGFDAPEFVADVEAVKAAATEIRSRLAALSFGEENPALVSALQEISAIRHRALVLAYNLNAYCNLETSIDAKIERARKESVRMQDLLTDLSAAILPLNLFLKKCSEDFLEKYLASDVTASEAFFHDEGRKAVAYSLSEEDEITLTQFRSHGPTAWGRLYNQLAGTLQAETSMGKMGLAQAGGYLRSVNENERREAWEGIQKAWKTYEEPVAGILNSLSGWRHEEYKKRSAKAPMDYLTQPLLDSRIERRTLDAMMQAIRQRQDLTQKSLALMARALGKEKVDAWDLLAPAPASIGAGKLYTFEEAIALIRQTFASLNPAMAEFLDVMVKNNWIEGRVLPNKRTGAFCSGFQKSRTPRVFQTYMGSLQDVSTLAHELGHAFHSWVMRDIPFFETRYPMTLAETASIFSETALADELARTGGASLLGEVAWADVSDAVAFLANIPARFEFEKNFYERRTKGPLSPRELSQLTDEAWREWYGDMLSGYESQFWMTKLHFSIPSVSFYNFPYSFGYLFSLAVYGYREEWGADFYPKYTALLRDTGRMTAEDLVEKHLGQNLRTVEFWLKPLAVVEKKVLRFEQLLGEANVRLSAPDARV
ncbi:MAG: M3 family oligoendopeptidase [Bdellovibrionaceae bacterium]|nr:M3 family oligoendopeptidase [Pseudobdellovibrionaceae bacterium]